VSAESRHPAEVTSARLAEHYEKWFGRFSGYELVAIGTVRDALIRIADEDEKGDGR
jgi:hypothetical protein